METIQIHKNDNGSGFFSLITDNQEVGRILVTITPEIVRAGYTTVDFSQRKSGYGRKLVDAVVDYARKNGLKVIADCGFVAMMFNKYPELYGDIRGTRS